MTYRGPHGFSFVEMYSYHNAGGVTNKRVQMTGTPFGLSTVNMDAGYTYDGEGRVLSITYPSSQLNSDGTTTPGPNYNYGYDTMGRGQINVTAFSGGASAFTKAVSFLNSRGRSAITNQIGNVTYVSPGNIGDLYTNPSTAVLLGNDAADIAATIFDNFNGATIVATAYACGHDFNRISNTFPGFLESRMTSPCGSPVIINQKDPVDLNNLVPGIRRPTLFEQDGLVEDVHSRILPP